METSEIRGIIPAMVTAFNNDESINEQEIRVHTRRMLDAGAHGLFPGGTNGEFYALTADERLQVLEIVLDEADGKIPVYAGTGAVTTREAIELSIKAEAAGASALSVITPYFAAASQSELVTHFTRVAEAVSIPVILYNIPARTGNSIAPATLGELSKVPNIVGVKDSSGNFDNLLQYLAQVPSDKDFAVLCGNDSLILWALMAGASGAITGVANVYPETMVGIYEAWESGDQGKARALQDSIRAFRSVFRHGNPNTVVKLATNLLGRPVGPCRAPFSTLPSAGEAELRDVLKADTARGMR
ncbi:4-hydroxy-tetrahydrodipicolinate synthase [Propionimicrobium sp. PCR01-08-3]|uniref:4-hydroxy-tetrahydrodipicolinate synthase n=1 Tax=Propionimicrobium sp. PCR01-08-3 TaxID=3052086 RepID=UPI00255D084D|nr:4-hydroxy-tetrahydrodipicolinate synthase [Propionimicrobium sp. PCR01-08-3]WIY81729.1 4-hydroxy-tetrahydrodipicolinate synthase [Propionimicrobium sp. PCR01-08-3]